MKTIPTFLLGMMGGVTLLSLIGWISPQTAKLDSLEVKHIKLIDDKGKIKGEIGYSMGTTSIRLQDSKEANGVLLCANDDGSSSLIFFNREHQSQVNLGGDKDGSVSLNMTEQKSINDRGFHTDVQISLARGRVRFGMNSQGTIEKRPAALSGTLEEGKASLWLSDGKKFTELTPNKKIVERIP